KSRNRSKRSVHHVVLFTMSHCVFAPELNRILACIGLTADCPQFGSAWMWTVFDKMSVSKRAQSPRVPCFSLSMVGAEWYIFVQSSKNNNNTGSIVGRKKCRSRASCEHTP